MLAGRVDQVLPGGSVGAQVRRSLGNCALHSSEAE